MSKLYAIVMAAGHGTRMKSELPKVLHRVAGRPLLYFPIRAALEAGADEVRVIVNPATSEAITASLQAEFPEAELKFCIQEVPAGTGDAVKAGVAGLAFQAGDRLLILSGDTPLLRKESLSPLLEELQQSTLALLSFSLSNPFGYGRVLYDERNQVRKIVEERDLKSELERRVNEVNAGVYAGDALAIAAALAELNCENAQGEYYLTDIVEILGKKTRVQSVLVGEEDLLGVNDRVHLRQVAGVLNDRIVEGHLRAGVSIFGEVQIDESVKIEADVTIYGGTQLLGASKIGKGTVIEAGCVLKDAEVGENVSLLPYSVVMQSRIAEGAAIGPFAHLRPESIIGAQAKVGNFVETKKAELKQGAKVNHLSYVGDAEVGEKANLGAGTIVCNYDGFQKQRTLIGAGAFIGSDSQLVAPVRIGAGAYVATGSTVVEDVPDNALAISRGRQTTKADYATGLRQKLQERAKKR